MQRYNGSRGAITKMGGLPTVHLLPKTRPYLGYRDNKTEGNGIYTLMT